MCMYHIEITGKILYRTETQRVTGITHGDFAVLQVADHALMSPGREHGYKIRHYLVDTRRSQVINDIGYTHKLLAELLIQAQINIGVLFS